MKVYLKDLQLLVYFFVSPFLHIEIPIAEFPST